MRSFRVETEASHAVLCQWAGHHSQGPWVSPETGLVPSGLESSNPSVTAALTGECQRGHVGASLEGHSLGEEVKKGQGGWGAGGLGLSPKGGHALFSSSEVDPPLPEQ